MTTLSFRAARACCRTTSLQLSSRRFVIAVIKAQVSLLLFINHLQATITVVNSAMANCNVILTQKCAFKNSIYNATTILQLSVDGGASSVSNYGGTIAYHWGGIKESSAQSFVMTTQTGSTAAAAAQEIAQTHAWLEPGEYYSGYTVTFDDSIGCDTQTHIDYWLVYFYPDDSECGFMDVDGSNVPTASVTMSAVNENVITSAAPTTTSIEQIFTPVPIPTPPPPLIPTLLPVVTDAPTIEIQLESVTITSSPSTTTTTTITTTIDETSIPTTASSGAVEMVLSPSGAVELVTVVPSTSPTEDVQNTFSSTTLTNEVVDTDDSANNAKHDGDDHPNNNTFIYIFVSVSVGSIIILASMVFFYRKELKQRRRNDGGLFKVQTVVVDNDHASTQSGTRSSPPTTTHESYFGTVQQSSCDYGDDISTLGDPYMGEGAITSNNLTDDPTVGGSTFVSKQDQLFTYGLRPRLGTADLESRMGNTTIGTGSKAAPNGMQFCEDITLEDIYQAAPLGVGEGHHHDFITVIAPAGQLGIVLNNPSDDFPMVYAVKDTSVLTGSVQVGDLLVSVDEVECKGMSSRTISSFLSSRSQNPTRTLILARGSVDV